jgi:hypothetical protein
VLRGHSFTRPRKESNLIKETPLIQLVRICQLFKFLCKFSYQHSFMLQVKEFLLFWKVHIKESNLKMFPRQGNVIRNHVYTCFFQHIGGKCYPTLEPSRTYLLIISTSFEPTCLHYNYLLTFYCSSN